MDSMHMARSKPCWIAQSEGGRTLSHGILFSMEEKSRIQALRENGPAAGSRYRHYKGGSYRVVDNAIHESTLEHLVIYGDAEGNVWARPLDDWSAFVEVNGRSVPRFALQTEYTGAA
jgi:hypothetical protein